jgi:hypothetical protein
LNVRISTYSNAGPDGVRFSAIASAALAEKWTRDPFDRLIVANAKANGFAWLISADEEIAKSLSADGVVSTAALPVEHGRPRLRIRVNSPLARPSGQATWNIFEFVINSYDSSERYEQLVKGR